MSRRQGALVRLVLTSAVLTAANLPGPPAGAASTAGGPEGDAQEVRHVPASEVEAAFDRGAVLLDGGAYMVHASRREAAGMAEVHLKDTDIVHVLRGTATLVTGGAVVGGKPTAADEVRGTAIEGGATRRLAEGDVLVIPRGVPHWFSEVHGPFLYYVVKVR